MFLEISIDKKTVLGLYEERRSHNHLQKVDGCDFVKDDEKTNKSTVGMKSFLFVVLGMIILSDE